MDFNDIIAIMLIPFFLVIIGIYLFIERVQGIPLEVVLDDLIYDNNCSRNYI